MCSRLVNLKIRSFLRFRNSLCNYIMYSGQTQIKQEPKYIFREVRNNSIIRDFANGLINPQVLKLPDSLKSDTVVKEIIGKLNNLPGHMSPDSFLEHLKKLGIFGGHIPQQYGGLGLSMTDYTYLIQHERLIDWSLALTVHQNLCAQAIIEFGSEDQKIRYLPDLASGKLIGAFCLTENISGSDMRAMETMGVLNGIEDHYVVDGTKNWVVNGAVADVMVVFVVTEDSRYEGGRQHLTALIVDRTMPGVSVTKQYQVACLPQSNLADVLFQSVFVPVCNVLGEDHAGYKVANQVQNSARCMVSACVAGWLRVLVEDLVARDRQGHFRGDSRVQALVNDSVTGLYAVESSLIFTTRFADQYQVSETELENAALKVFSTEAGKSVVDKYLRIICLVDGAISPDKARICDRISYIDSFLGSNYFNRLYIGGTMIEMSRIYAADVHERSRSSKEKLSLMSATLKNMRRRIVWTEEAKDSRYGALIERTLFIDRLQPIFRSLQLARLRLFRALRRHGKASLDRQSILEAMSNVGVLVYVLSSCIARANSTYGDFEMACTSMFIDEATKKINEHIESLSHVTREVEPSLVYPLSEDISTHCGYPSVIDVLQLRSSSSLDDHASDHGQ